MEDDEIGGAGRGTAAGWQDINRTLDSISEGGTGTHQNEDDIDKRSHHSRRM